MLICFLLAFAPAAFSQDCPIMEPSVCNDNDVVCDMGMTGNCWMGDYCMPEGSVCPTACYTPAPAVCSPSDVVCDMGMTGNCWMGDYCMPEGSVCPTACYTPAPAVCSPSEVVC